MAHLFRDGTLGGSKRMNGNSARFSISDTVSVRLPSTEISSPFGELDCNLSDSDLRETAYEILVSVCRSTGGKPLNYLPQSDKTQKSISSSSFSSLQKSVTSSAANRFKKVVGLKSSKKSQEISKKPVTIDELMRVQMRISEQTDSRIRKALMRIAAVQFGRRIESMVLPLELLQQYKSSDFSNQKEYESWQIRILHVLEAGLLLHPHLPLDNSNTTSQRLRKIINDASQKPIETRKNSEQMQILHSTVMSLACRTFNGSNSDTCHWADGFPLNLRFYQILLEACFDVNEETCVIEEVDEVIELIKKTWVIFGINKMLHNLCLLWVLFHRFFITGEVEDDLVFAANNQLVEVAKDVKASKDPVYLKFLSSTLSSILGWAEKRLRSYHETFNRENIYSMQDTVSLGVLAAKLLDDEISHEYHGKRNEEVDVSLDRIDTYIRSSLRTAFARKMEKADSNGQFPNSPPVLCLLAKDISELVANEKEIFSPILKRWHPHAAGVAVATLHACYGKELKRFISGISELTPNAMQVLKVADKLEKVLVQVAVEESVESEDGGKAIIREMPPYEAETTIANLVKIWIKTREERLMEWVDRNLQLEVWNPGANKERIAPSAVEVLRLVDETLDAFFQLPIPMHPTLLPDLITSLDICLHHYISKANSGCGTRNTLIPSMPSLTRCTRGSKFQGIWKKKKEKSKASQRKKPQGRTINGENYNGILQICIRMNTLQHIQTELVSLEKRIITYLRNTESATMEDFAHGLVKKFDLSEGACPEGIKELCEALAYKVIFHDLSHVLWGGLYVKEPSFSRIEPLLEEINQILEIIADTVHNKIRIRVITDVMKASYDGFLFVLLAGGPSRAFSLQDYHIIEDDFKALEELYWSNGDGLPMDLIEKSSALVRSVLPLFCSETESLIEQFRLVTLETYGSPSAKSKLPLPPTSGQWNPTEPNTILRVLCHRKDVVAIKFLKKTYNLPKKL